tara:strand:+ start:1036 stop:1182 length:147 start_codon:yes stop_codon:yes gene_type:complete
LWKGESGLSETGGRMVLIKNFEEFYSAAEELYNRNPDKVRSSNAMLLY